VAAESRYIELALAALGPMREMLARYPQGFAQWLIALGCALAHPREVSIVGDVEAAATRPCSTRVPPAIVLTRCSRLESPGLSL
jgi:hypothetical protein